MAGVAGHCLANMGESGELSYHVLRPRSDGAS